MFYVVHIRRFQGKKWTWACNFWERDLEIMALISLLLEVERNTILSLKLKDVEIQQSWGQQTWSLCFAKISGLALPPLGVFYLWWGVGCGIL